MPGPLAGIRALDLTSVLAGPLTGRMLAELGADVTHIESPRGDDGRNSTTPYLGREGLIYLNANRSKRGVVIDFTRPEGAAVIRRMLARADVFIENFRTGQMERYGLGYEQTQALNPRLVYVSISGYGDTGPMATTPGYDVVMQGFVGATRPAGPGDLPALNAVLIADTTAPLIASYGVALALLERQTSGRGQRVSTSLLEGALWMTSTSTVWAENDPPKPNPPPAVDPTLGIFLCADERPIVLAAWSPPQWLRLCDLLDLPHLAAEPGYRDRPGRVADAATLRPLFEGLIRQRPAAEWVALLNEQGIPCAHADPDQLAPMQHPQVQALGMVATVEHPTKGTLHQYGLPLRLSATPGVVRGPAPLQGQHTRAVLADYGFTAAEIADLLASGVAQAASDPPTA